MARRAAKPAHVSDLLTRVFRSAGIEQRMAQARVLAEWPTMVGERVAALATAESVRDDGILMVSVKTAA